MDDLEQLRNAILNKYNDLNATELPTSIAVPSGSDAIQRGIDALGPDNDACYLWTSTRTPNLPTSPFPNLSQYSDFMPNPAITLGNATNEFIIVYGVNHVATGKVTYENFVLYGADGSMALEQSMTRNLMELLRNICPTIPTRSTSMSTRLPGIARAIHTALGFPRVRSLRRRSGSTALHCLEELSGKGYKDRAVLLRDSVR